MIAAIRLGLQLGLGSARDQRLRTASVLAAVLIGTVVLLSTAAITHSEQAQHPHVYDNPDNLRLLAAVVVSILFPDLVLAATVGRLSAALRDRRMANLRLLGMGAASVRLAAAVETGVAAFAGALLGVAGFLVARQPLAGVRVAGHAWAVDTLRPPTWTYFGVVVLLTAVVMTAGALPQRLTTADALARARRADVRRPGWWRVVPLALGALGCLYVIRANTSTGIATPTVIALFGGVALLGTGLILLVPVFVRLLADLTLRCTQRPVLTIAARRLQAQPAGVSRVISGLLVGLFLIVGARAVVVAFESTPQYENAYFHLHQEQVASGMVPATALASTLRRLGGIRQIRHVVALPVLSSPCESNADQKLGCITAVVATCPQLQSIEPGVKGFVPGKPMILYSLPAPTARLLPLRRVHDGRIVKQSTGVRVPPNATRLHTGSDASRSRLGDPLGATIVLPPSLPGIGAAIGGTDRSVVAIAAPGRNLPALLDRAGVSRLYADNLADYDLVAELRALVWSIAAVILSIGLLAFAVASVDRAVNRRREVTALQLVGVPRSALRRTQWIEAAAPLALGCFLAIALGMLAGATYLNLIHEGTPQPLPWTTTLVLAALAALGSAVVGGFTVIASTPRISPNLIRRE